MREKIDLGKRETRERNRGDVEDKESQGWFFDSVESAISAAGDVYDSATETIEDKADKFFGEDDFSDEVEEVIIDFKERAQEILSDFHRDVSAGVPRTEKDEDYFDLGSNPVDSSFGGGDSARDRKGVDDAVDSDDLPEDLKVIPPTEDYSESEEARNDHEEVRPEEGKFDNFDPSEEEIQGVLDSLEKDEPDSSQSHREIEPQSFNTSRQRVECRLDIDGETFETKTGQEFDAGGTKKYFELTNGDEDLLLALPLRETGGTAQIGESEQANANLFNEARVHEENPDLDLIDYAGLVAFESNTGEAVQIDVEKFKEDLDVEIENEGDFEWHYDRIKSKIIEKMGKK
jgi:hypothetical protein